VHTEVNFYESCTRRDRILALAAQPSRSPGEVAESVALWVEWRNILLNELRNARQALPVAQMDMRLDFYYGSDHTFPHLESMLRAKIQLLRSEIKEFLPLIQNKILM
jgi:hypothetical protein